MARLKQPTVKHSAIRHHRLRTVFALAIVVVAGLISYWYLFLNPLVECDDAYVTGNIIPVQALVSGVVSRVGVDNSMFAHTGDWLLSEEQSLTRTQMDKARSDLAEALRQTKSLFAQADGEIAAIAALEARRKKLVADLARYEIAEPSGAVSSQKVYDTKADIVVIERQVAKERALLRKAKSLVSGSSLIDNPLVQSARSAFVESYIRYRRSSIFSPASGYVADRRVQAGERVVSGQRLMSIVPLDELWVTANIKETRMAHVRTGETVEIHAQVYGSEITFHGKVIGVEPSGGSTFSPFPPNNATGNYIHIVERVPVRISLQASELKANPLRPGMSVAVEIETRNYQSLGDLVSDVRAAGASYATPIYDQEVMEAQRAANRIVEQNGGL